MMENQRQHFIPQFYLRGFSFENKGVQIAMYHMLERRFIASTGLKKQGYEDYLYGRDGQIEKELSKIEAICAPVLLNAREKKVLPVFRSETQYQLLRFVILMSSRNPSSANEAIEAQAQLFKTIEKMSPGSLPQAPIMDQLTAIRMILGNLPQVVDICLDLKSKLIVNRTNVPFITSDNPLVEYNQFLEQRGVLESITGYGSIGLQLFLPIDAKTMLMYYDDLVYRVGDRKREIVELINPVTVNQLNMVQFLNADLLIYCNEEADEKYLTQLMLQSLRFEKPNLPIVNVLPLHFKGEPNKPPSDVIHIKKTEIKIKIQIENVLLTKRAKSHVLSNRVAHLRPRAQAFAEDRRNPPASFTFREK